MFQTVSKCTLNIENKFSKNKIKAEFLDPSQSFVVICDNCDINSEQIHLCVNSHVGCNLCTEQCLNCEKDVCQQCSNQFNPCYICKDGLCNDCSEKCGSCGEVTCENHLIQCPHCSKNLCYFCSDSCEVCSKRFCDRTVQECFMCGKRICKIDSEICVDCEQYVCPTDREFCVICNKIHCGNDSAVCKICEQIYSKGCVQNNYCNTCNNFIPISSDSSEVSEIVSMDSELGKFKKWEHTSNSRFSMYKAKKMFGKKIIVYDKQLKQIIVNKKGGWR